MVRNLARNGVGFNRVAVGTAAVVAIPAADVDEWELDQKPETGECDQAAQWDGGRGGVGPDEKVEDENCSEEKTRDQCGGDDRVVLPQSAVECLVDACREVATEGTREDEQRDADADETASEAWVEDTKAGEDDETNGHDNELHAGAGKRSK